jgi:hypothetical protein
MKLQIIFIDEPIHVEDQIACNLWQKTLWAKEKGYRSHYKAATMPLGADDFFATHYIVAEEKSTGGFEPIAMSKSVRRSQCLKFNVPFGANSLLKAAGLDGDLRISEILKSDDEISYEGSWSINPEYQKDRELSNLLRDYMTLFACRYFQTAGIPRWLAAGVTQFKVDKYFEWLGGKEVVPEFPLEMIDNQTVRMMYFADAYHPPKEPMAIAEGLTSQWNNRIVFKPTSKKGIANVF